MHVDLIFVYIFAGKETKMLSKKPFLQCVYIYIHLIFFYDVFLKACAPLDLIIKIKKKCQAYNFTLKIILMPFSSLLHFLNYFINSSFIPAGDVTNELVRHFLIETSPKGVRLKGCPNEPYFGKQKFSFKYTP